MCYCVLLFVVRSSLFVVAAWCYCCVLMCVVCGVLRGGVCYLMLCDGCCCCLAVIVCCSLFAD